MKLNSVVVDIVLEERNLCCANVLLWDRPEFHPYTSLPESKPKLRINLLASRPRKGFEAKVRAIYDSTTWVKQCFSNIEFSYSDYNSSTDMVYKDHKLSSINAIAALQNGLHLRLNVASLALKADWLKGIEAEPIDGEEWIKSAIYDGISVLDPTLDQAVHTCGLYNVTEAFSKYIAEVWQPIVQKYSIAGEEMTPTQLLFKALDDPTYSDNSVAEFKSRFVSCGLFSHHDGPYENKHYDGVALRRLLRNPSLVIGMSKHLFRELETIDISYSEYRKSVRQFFRNNEI